MFDRKWFNRAYFLWFNSVYKRDKNLAMEVDIEVIGGLGKKMAEEIRDSLLVNTKSANLFELIYEALKESHWFQEDVELVKVDQNSLMLQTKNCSFQKCWIKNHNEPCFCINSHKAFLESFCKVFDSGLIVENLVQPSKDPANNVYCSWLIHKK